MNIAEFLSPDAVIDPLVSRDKKGVLHEIAGRLSAVRPGVDREAFLRVLEARERAGSTGIGEGIAIPHGKVPGLDGLIACFGRSPEGVDFESMDGRPTRLFFALVAPESAAGIHLKALGRVSRLFRDIDFREAILAADGAREIYERFVEADEGGRV